MSYVLPLKWLGDDDREKITNYLTRLEDMVTEVIVVDGSEAPAFAATQRCGGQR
ncbi:MAG: hypothetical protein M3360_11055 [Actinomycetota bacterium]|nr:hypothetical protein [Actinomycetota bacterium]